jgi:peptide/nickel transport system permease protein
MAKPLRIVKQLLSLGLGTVGLLLALGVILLAVIGPFVTPHSPVEFVGYPYQPAGSGIPLGADGLGRDVLSRLLAGGSGILTLAAIATLLGVIAGALMGIAAGYMKGTFDELVMRVLDVAMAFPQTILALLFVSIVGPEPWLIALMVGVIHAPQVARVARSASLKLADADFVLFAETTGASSWKIMTREILPNIADPLLVELGLRFTYSIALIAGLSFLGFGQQPPTPDWGLMINENRLGMAQNPWSVLAPIALIAVLTIGMNLFTDSISRLSRSRSDDSSDAAASDQALDAGSAGAVR